jgi:hypothetical protein
MRFATLLVLALLITVPFAPAQARQNSPAPQPTASSTDVSDIQEYVDKEFGTEFKVVGPPRLDVDMNGDGIADAVIIARSKDPLLGQGEFHYKVIDPYNDFFGYGNPKVTLQFATNADPTSSNMVLLVVHGVGPDGWRSTAPKPKFALVNVPYQKLEFKRATLKKKLVTTIMAEDVDEVEAAVYWDGKKYKWEPLGSSH